MGENEELLLFHSEIFITLLYNFNSIMYSKVSGHEELIIPRYTLQIQ